VKIFGEIFYFSIIANSSGIFLNKTDYGSFEPIVKCKYRKKKIIQKHSEKGTKNKIFFLKSFITTKRKSA